MLWSWAWSGSWWSALCPWPVPRTEMPPPALQIARMAPAELVEAGVGVTRQTEFQMNAGMPGISAVPAKACAEILLTVVYPRALVRTTASLDAQMPMMPAWTPAMRRWKAVPASSHRLIAPVVRHANRLSRQVTGPPPWWACSFFRHPPCFNCARAGHRQRTSFQPGDGSR